MGGEAIELDKLGDFHPETGMILANSTSVGMQPDIGMSPIPKVRLLYPRNGVSSLQCKLTEVFLWASMGASFLIRIEECLSYLVEVGRALLLSP